MDEKIIRENSICDMIKGGMQYKDISSILGCSMSYISGVSKKYNIKSINRVIVTEKQSLEIIDLYSKKVPVQDIANRYGINRTTILLILKRYDKKAVNHNVLFNEEQIQFISENYPKYGAKYCAKILNVNSRQVVIKAFSMKIKRIKFPTTDKRLKHRLRSMIPKIIKNRRMTKYYEEIIGCDYNFFISHIEKNFINGMCWENYGKVWEFDHIKPVSLFDLKNKENFKIANHYTNIKPLWRTTNIAMKHNDFSNIGNRNKSNDYMEN